MRNSEQTQLRKINALRTAMGPTIAEALADPTVVEVMVNPDGRIWIDRFSTGMTVADQTLAPADAESIMRILADHAQVVVSSDFPRVSATLPLTNERFQGEFPPIVENPSFAIRKPASRIFTIDDYTAQGVMTPDQAALIRKAVTDHLNILVIGGTGSGKTTLLNALLAEPALIPERILIIEQTRELQCIAPNLIKLQTREIAPFVTMTDLVRDALRLRPDRIIVGEVRDGAAWDMIKSWNTGHDGGFGTIHANSPVDALYRIEDLVGEVMQRIPYRAIGAAINLILEIKRTPQGRRITSILRVEGWENGNYLFNHC